MIVLCWRVWALFKVIFLPASEKSGTKITEWAVKAYERPSKLNRALISVMQAADA